MPMTTLWYAMQAGPARDHDGFAEPVETIDGEHDVGRFGGGGRAAGADGDAHVGECERGGVVDAVADHDRSTGALFELDGVDFLGGCPFGEDVVDADDGPDGLRVVLAVAGDHHDAPDAVPAELANGSGGVGADRVVEEQRADGCAVDLDEDGECTVERGAPPDAAHPARARRCRRPARLADRDVVTLHDAADPVSGHLVHVLG